jgi:hypothetical protein
LDRNEPAILQVTRLMRPVGNLWDPRKMQVQRALNMSASQPDFWGHQGPVSGRGGPHFAELINQVRGVQEQVAAAQLPAHVATEVVSQLSDIAGRWADD